MSKLPHLEAARREVGFALGLAKTKTCEAHLSEAISTIEALIRLEHDGQLREIRHNGT